MPSMTISQSKVLTPRTLARREESLCLRGEESLYISKSDQGFWTQRCSEVLYGLMRNTGSYTEAQMSQHLRLLSDTIVPSLGPRPESAPTIPLLTSSNSPFEPSWNITDTGSSAIRFSFEPLGRQGGSVSDPFAQKIVSALLPSLEGQATGLDTRWFNHFMSELFLNDEESKLTKSRLPEGVRAPTSFLAFDLDGSKSVFKAYFFPILKNIATGRTCEDITFDCIRTLQPGGSKLAPAAEALEKFLSESPIPCPIEMIAIDCIDPALGARVKVYGRTESNSFDTVRYVATLNGVNTSEETLEGLRILEGIWHLLHNEPVPMATSESKAPKVFDTRHKGVCYGFELKPGSAVPEVKIYVPLWQYAESDAAVAANLADVFSARGWPVGAEYEGAIRESFPRADLDGSSGTHSYMSFAYSKKKGVYMTMYYSAVPLKNTPVAL